MLGTSRIKVTGRGSNIEFVLDDLASFASVSQELRYYLRNNNTLYSTGAITINIGNRVASPEQLAALKRIVEGESGLKVQRFWRAVEPVAAAAEPPATLAETASGKPPEPHYPQHNDFVLENAASPPESPRAVEPPPHRGKEALLIKTNCRSGEVIRYPGDVVALADVNPGAEILADGDILVFGALRGLAHAGASGDTGAAIIALKLDTPRLRIGPYSGLAPAAPLAKGNGDRPKIAYVRQRSIYVADFAGRFLEYARGILYEG